MAAQPALGGILPPKGATVSIFGQKVSWDALLIAAAGLAGVIFLYKVGQPTSTASAMPLSTVDASGGGADAATMSTVPTSAPGPMDYTNAGYAGPLGPPGSATPPTPPPNVGPYGPSPSGGSAPGPQIFRAAAQTSFSGGGQAPQPSAPAVGSIASTVLGPSVGSGAGAAMAALGAAPAAPTTVVGGGGGALAQ